VTGQASTDPGAVAVGGVRVRVDFKVSDEQAAQAVTAKMVDRAHEIANQPDCECDVDVSVEWSPPDGAPAQVEQLGKSARGRPTDL
jgi:acetylornithine deacetylase/succinyl-diaminopimelate desuccinylase-like protein